MGTAVVSCPAEPPLPRECSAPVEIRFTFIAAVADLVVSGDVCFQPSGNPGTLAGQVLGADQAPSSPVAEGPLTAAVGAYLSGAFPQAQAIHRLPCGDSPLGQCRAPAQGAGWTDTNEPCRPQGIQTGTCAMIGAANSNRANSR